MSNVYVMFRSHVLEHGAFRQLAVGKSLMHVLDTTLRWINDHYESDAWWISKGGEFIGVGENGKYPVICKLEHEITYDYSDEFNPDFIKTKLLELNNQKTSIESGISFWQNRLEIVSKDSDNQS